MKNNTIIYGIENEEEFDKKHAGLDNFITGGSATDVPDFIPLDEIDQWEHDENGKWFKKSDR